TGTLFQITPNVEGLEFTLGGTTAAKTAVTIQDAVAIELKSAPAFKASFSELDTLAPEQTKGKVLFVELAGVGFQAVRRLPPLIAKLQPALIVLPGGPRNRLLREAPPQIPMLSISDAAIREIISDAKSGPMEATVSAHIAAPKIDTVKLR